MKEYTKEEQKAHRKLWVEALRGGKYEQGTGVLKRGNTFCCLGVACDISGLGKWEPYESGDVGVFSVHEGGYRSAFILPWPIMHWLGLGNAVGKYNLEGPPDNTSLSDLNDHAGYNFNQIADIIESEPEGFLAIV